MFIFKKIKLSYKSFQNTFFFITLLYKNYQLNWKICFWSLDQDNVLSVCRMWLTLFFFFFLTGPWKSCDNQLVKIISGWLDHNIEKCGCHLQFSWWWQTVQFLCVLNRNIRHNNKAVLFLLKVLQIRFSFFTYCLPNYIF